MLPPVNASHNKEVEVRLLSVALAALVVALGVTGVAGAKPPAKPLPPDQAQSLAQTTTGPPVGAVQTVLDGAEGGGGGSCYSNAWTWGQGLWPYNVSVTLHTTWCGSNGAITYRDSWTSHDSYLCDGGQTDYDQRVAGGAGYSSVVVEGGAYFSCATAVPWFTIHEHIWEQINYTWYGGSWAVAWS